MRHRPRWSLASTRLVCPRPWVQSLHLKKKKRETEHEREEMRKESGGETVGEAQAVPFLGFTPNFTEEAMARLTAENTHVPCL